MSTNIPLVRLGQGVYAREIKPGPTGPVRGKIDLARVFGREPTMVYHARRGDYLTAHALADFRRCQLLFRRKELGLVADRDTDAFLVGRAAHTLILEGRDRYEAEFVVGGPINAKTGKPFGSGTKAFAEWAEKRGKPVLADDQAALVEQMAASVLEHAVARELLAEGVAEGVVRAEYGGLPCQARIDWVNPVEGRGIIDLKTCDTIDEFERDINRYGYVHQMAFYRELVVEACGVELEVHLIAVEKREPYRCGVWRLSRRLLDRAADENLAAIDRLKRCRELGVWETGFESPRLIDIEEPSTKENA